MLGNPLPYDYATNGGLAIYLDDFWPPVWVKRSEELAPILFEVLLERGLLLVLKAHDHTVSRLSCAARVHKDHISWIICWLAAGVAHAFALNIKAKGVGAVSNGAG